MSVECDEVPDPFAAVPEEWADAVVQVGNDSPPAHAPDPAPADAVAPFRDAAAGYLAAGWWPVPCDAKQLLVSGVSGCRGRRVVAADVAQWSTQFPNANVALRLPPDVVCLDVDDYDDKPGGATLAAGVAEYGPLPPTVIATARALPSGRRLYRVPNGTRLRSPGPGIDMVQHHQRYCVVAPSSHHSGGPVQWIDESSGEVLDTIPEPGDLPELPWSWLEALSVSGSGQVGDAVDDEAVLAWCEQHTDARRPGWLPVVIDGARERIAAGEARHDCVLRAACQMAREATAGAYAASDAVDALVALWAEVMDDPKRGDEVGELIGWAVGQLATDHAAAQVDAIRSKLAGPGVGTLPQPVDGSDPTALLRLPADFWTERPTLDHIRRAALARMVAPDVVLHCVLARVAALSSHTLELPPNVGSAVGLSYLVMPTGPPEAGKSSAIGTARDVLPAPGDHPVADNLPLGSGEGLAEVLFDTVTEPDPDTGKPTKVRKQVRHQAIVVVDEGTMLAELSQRKGSTVASVLRTIFTHGTIGNTNASADRRRVVPGDRYVFGVIVGIQPSLAGPLLDPVAVGAGTPQRFAWCWCIDPSLSPDYVEWPGPLDWSPHGPGDLAKLERVVNHGSTVRHRLPVPAAIRDEVRAGIFAARTDPDSDPLGAHRYLMRLKVAALLGILDGRLGLSADDWRLAGQVVDTSRNVRRYVAAVLAQVEARRETAQVSRLIRREEASEDAAASRALSSAVRTVVRKVNVLGHATRSDLTRAIAGRDRKLVTTDEVIARAVSEGLLAVDGDGWKPGRKKP